MKDDAGGITPALLLQAYASGVFPMAELADAGTLFWVDPERRGSCRSTGCTCHAASRAASARGLRHPRRRRLRGGARRLRRAARDLDQRRIRRLYLELHRLGHAHSVEVWRDGRLAGGLYGVALGGAFFGESMFSRVRDASKFALIALVARLNAGGFRLLDTQFVTDHLARLGAVEISRADYRRRLASRSVARPTSAACAATRAPSFSRSLPPALRPGVDGAGRSGHLGPRTPEDRGCRTPTRWTSC